MAVVCPYMVFLNFHCCSIQGILPNSTTPSIINLATTLKKVHYTARPMTRGSKTKIAGQVDWNSFVQQPDAHFESNFAESTKRNMHFVRSNFQRCIFAAVYSFLAANPTLRYFDASAAGLQVLAQECHAETYRRVPSLVP